jgi:hypothetical protein
MRVEAAFLVTLSAFSDLGEGVVCQVLGVQEIHRFLYFSI